MLKIKEYIKAESLQQAYELNQQRNSVVLGGMLWLKMQDKRLDRAIDLSGLSLDSIEEDAAQYRIGAMVTLRQLEQHAGLLSHTNGALKEALCHIVGVQFRNGATVGGSIFSRFGFSDVITAFLVMDTQVELFGGGIWPLAEFLKQSHKGDILVRLIINKDKMKMTYLSQRNTSTDFPVLTCALSKTDMGIKCAIGARPQRAVCITDSSNMLDNKITLEAAEAFAENVKKQLVFGSNMRAGAAYRRHLAGVLIRRGLLALEEM